ncbi:MAG: triose-phosphate isomerase [Candidatus Harrisonbacteria bacterium]|nr:triose-phosphate isomerase [Candidatus Harrisonbacteria bacterium]
MKNLLIANWKMNPPSLEEALVLARSVDLEGAVLCPPFLYLEPVAQVIKRATLGAQDLSYDQAGAHTGEVSASQLKDLGVEYVLVGHSERRALGESDESVHKKLEAALAAGLKAVLCVGESAQTREAGQTKEFIKGQLDSALTGLEADSIIVAYEPIWAIGSANPAQPEEVESIASLIKARAKEQGIEARILYGGSTEAGNILDYLSLESITGTLVGGSSLDGAEFQKMLELSNQ